jgi:hypothetical protein
MDNHTTESTESTDPLEVPYEPSDAPSAEVEEKEGVDSGSSDDDEANEPIESAPPKPTLCPEELENVRTNLPNLFACFIFCPISFFSFFLPGPKRSWYEVGGCCRSTEA